MERYDPWLYNTWPWNIHIEIRKPKIELTEEQVDAIRSVLSGESLEDYEKRKAAENEE